MVGRLPRGCTTTFLPVDGLLVDVTYDLKASAGSTILHSDRLLGDDVPSHKGATPRAQWAWSHEAASHAWTAVSLALWAGEAKRGHHKGRTQPDSNLVQLPPFQKNTAQNQQVVGLWWWRREDFMLEGSVVSLGLSSVHFTYQSLCPGVQYMLGFTNVLERLRLRCYRNQTKAKGPSCSACQSRSNSSPMFTQSTQHDTACSATFGVLWPSTKVLAEFHIDCTAALVPKNHGLQLIHGYTLDCENTFFVDISNVSEAKHVSPVPMQHTIDLIFRCQLL